MKTLGSLALVALAFTAASAGAQAAAPAEAYSVAVEYGDLNLADAKGMAAFESRVKQSAGRICGSAHVRPLKEARNAKECQAQFTNAAMAQVQRLAGRSSGGVAASR